jgi:hypothetical protein
MYEGYSCKLIPFKNKIQTGEAGLVDTDHLYKLMTETFSWDNLARTDYFIDYQNLYTHLGVFSLRNLFVTAANSFIDAGETERAKEMLDKCQEVAKSDRYPLESIPLGFSGNDFSVIEMITDYYLLGETEKARSLALELFNDLIETAGFYLEFYEYSKSDFELCGNYIYYLQDALTRAGDKDLAQKMDSNFNALLDYVLGKGPAEPEQKLEAADSARG